MPDSISNLKSIFGQALDIASPAERARYLDQACLHNEAVRTEIEDLIAAAERAGNFLSPAAPEGQGLGEQPLHAVGSSIGPYKLLELIGEGGMGLVYMAEQQQPVRRRVALKIVKPGMDSRQIVARFEAERQALAMMDHGNIAKVLDAGMTPEGRSYFVMELVNGVPITSYCDEKQLTTEERLKLFVPICQALQHAHQKGVIHRDIKPTNVLVALYDGAAVPKVIDFGVAKATGQKLTEKTMFTGFGQLIGTLDYMSPEQAQFNQLDIDTRSDIYSLGVLLYELLTGSTPFERARDKGAALDETLRIIREEEPETVSARIARTRSMERGERSFPLAPRSIFRAPRWSELDWIVMKCLEKDRNRRYETAFSLANDLGRLLRDEPVHACPPSVIYRFTKFLRRNKAGLAVATGLLLTVAAMATAGWIVRDHAVRQSKLAQTEIDRQAAGAREVRSSLNVARALMSENKLGPARETLARARAQLHRDSPALDGLTAEVEAGQAALDRFQHFLESIDRGYQAETAPLDESAEAPSSGEAELAVSALMPAPGKLVSRRPAAAVPFLLEALQLYSVLERDDWRTALDQGFLATPQIEQIRRAAYEVLLWLADDVVRRQHEHRSEQAISYEAAAQQGLVYLQKAAAAQMPTQALYLLRARCQKALGQDEAAQADQQLADGMPPTIAIDHFLRGQAALSAKKLTEGVEAFEAALRVEPTHYWSLMKMGYCFGDLGRDANDFANAVRIFTGCILKRPDHAHAYYCRANAYWDLRRYEDALADYAKAIELDPSHLRARYVRGELYDKLNQRDQAIADFSKAIELAPGAADMWYSRGRIHTKSSHFQEAFADFTKATEIVPTSARYWGARGMSYNRLNRPDKAVPDFDKALELDPRERYAWYGRGMSYIELKQPNKARDDLDKAIELSPKDAYAWCARGTANDMLGETDRAFTDFARALELKANYAAPYYHRGNALNRLKKYEEALADLAKAVELAPSDARMTNNLAWLLATCPDETLRDGKRAVEVAEKAVQRAPKSGSYWNTLGVARYRAGDWNESISALNKAVEMRRGGDASDQFFLTMCYWKLENHDEANAAYERATAWMERNKDALKKDARYAEELRRFQTEAEEVLQRSSSNEN